MNFPMASHNFTFSFRAEDQLSLLRTPSNQPPSNSCSGNWSWAYSDLSLPVVPSTELPPVAVLEAPCLLTPAPTQQPYPDATYTAPAPLGVLPLELPPNTDSSRNPGRSHPAFLPHQVLQTVNEVSYLSLSR